MVKNVPFTPLLENIIIEPHRFCMEVAYCYWLLFLVNNYKAFIYVITIIFPSAGSRRKLVYGRTTVYSQADHLAQNTGDFYS